MDKPSRKDREYADSVFSEWAEMQRLPCHDLPQHEPTRDPLVRIQDLASHCATNCENPDYVETVALEIYRIATRLLDARTLVTLEERDAILSLVGEEV